MAGRYTRFGDVRALLASADDRYVVFKGGDAVRLEFDAAGLPPVPAGWTRDWVIVLDGWDKDADKNTVAGQTVEPLPFHGHGRRALRRARRPERPGHGEFVREYLTRRAGRTSSATRSAGRSRAGRGDVEIRSGRDPGGRRPRGPSLRRRDLAADASGVFRDITQSSGIASDSGPTSGT